MNIFKKSSFVLLFFQLPLVGCVTTNESPYSDIATESNVLHQRLALARRYIGSSNWENAKRNLQLATEISPKNPEVYEVYALFHQSTGELDLAESYFNDAINLNPSFSRARNNYAAYLSGL